MLYPLRSDTPDLRKRSQAWQRALGFAIDELTHDNQSLLLDYSYYHGQTLEMEMEKNARVTTPKYVSCKSTEQ